MIGLLPSPGSSGFIPWSMTTVKKSKNKQDTHHTSKCSCSVSHSHRMCIWVGCDTQFCLVNTEALQRPIWHPGPSLPNQGWLAEVSTLPLLSQTDSVCSSCFHSACAGPASGSQSRGCLPRELPNIYQIWHAETHREISLFTEPLCYPFKTKFHAKVTFPLISRHNTSSVGLLLIICVGVRIAAPFVMCERKRFLLSVAGFARRVWSKRRSWTVWCKRRKSMNFYTVVSLKNFRKNQFLGLTKELAFHCLLKPTHVIDFIDFHTGWRSSVWSVSCL